MIDVFKRLAEWLEAGRSAVMVTVVATAGSSPREAGAKMAVGAEDFAGSIGGGQLERMALDIARAMIAADDRAPVVKTVALGPSVGQCCGGQVALLFEPLVAAGFHLALFGAGHVARALVGVLKDVPCRIDWIDGRENEFPAEMPPRARKIVASDPVAKVARLRAGTLALVMTHSHDLDHAIVAALLRRDDLPYVGLIGSVTKRARFEHRLGADGFDRAQLDRLVCPIGVDGVDGKHPGRIAIAAAAQLLQYSPTDSESGPSSRDQWAAWREIETGARG